MPDLSRERVARIRTLMDAHIYDAVVMGYEEIVPQLSLPDPDDNHVLECMRTMRESLKRPELSSDAFLDRLEKLGLPVSAQALRDYSDFI